MKKVYRNQLSTLLALCFFALVASMPMFAFADTDAKSDSATVEEAAEKLEEAQGAIIDAAEAIEDDKAENSDLMEYAEKYLEKAETAFEESDYDGAVEWSEKAISKVEYILEGDDKDDNKDAKDDDDGYKHKDEYKDDTYESDKDKKETVYSDDKFKDYGKSDDYAELQAQLQEVMQLLIQLLTLQLAQQTAS